MTRTSLVHCLALALGATASAARGSQAGGGEPLVGLPRATGVANAHVVGGQTPKPTAPPEDPVPPGSPAGSSGSGGASNAWLNEHTCGWLAGASSFPWTCASGMTCATDTAHAVACISGDYAPFFTVCLDFEAYQRGDCSSVGPRTGCCHTSSVGRCGTFLWLDAPPRSMFRCFPEATIISLRDRPQFVIDASTTGTSAPTPPSSPGTYTAGTETTAMDVHGGAPPRRQAHHVGATIGGVVAGAAALAFTAGLVAYLAMSGRLNLRAKLSRKTATITSRACGGTPAAGPPERSSPHEGGQETPSSPVALRPAPGLAL